MRPFSDNSKLIFRIDFILGLHIKWHQTLDAIENQHHSSSNFRIMIQSHILKFVPSLRPFFNTEPSNLFQLPYRWLGECGWHFSMVADEPMQRSQTALLVLLTNTLRPRQDGQFTINHHWFRYCVVAEQATSHYLNEWWYSLLTHICTTRPQWVK